MRLHAHRTLKAAALMLLTFLLTAGAAYAQGRIVGTVTDASTGEALPGANVVIQGTSKGAATDLDGQYSIAAVSAGTHTLVASFVGYERVEQQVTVEDGETVTVDIELPWAAAHPTSCSGNARASNLMIGRPSSRRTVKGRPCLFWSDSWRSIQETP